MIFRPPLDHVQGIGRLELRPRLRVDRGCVPSRPTSVRKLGRDVEGPGEVMAVVGPFHSTGVLAYGDQIEPDVFPLRVG